jgi:cytochrome c oxidase subunit I+III
MPGPSWASFLAAIFTAAFFLLLTVKLVTIAMVCGVIAVVMVIWWMWSTDPGPSHPPVDIGGGMQLPVYVTGPVSHSWWAMIVLILVAGTTFTCLVFSYFYLWTVNPGAWPPAGVVLPTLIWPAAATVLYLAGSALIALASRALARSPTAPSWSLRLALLLAVVLMIGGFAAHLYGPWETGLRPDASGYAAVVYMFVALQGFFVTVMSIMALYTLARSLLGMLNGVRRATFDNTMLLWHYTSAQGLVALAVSTFFPRLVG